MRLRGERFGAALSGGEGLGGTRIDGVSAAWIRRRLRRVTWLDQPADPATPARGVAGPGDRPGRRFDDLDDPGWFRAGGPDGRGGPDDPGVVRAGGPDDPVGRPAGAGPLPAARALGAFDPGRRGARALFVLALLVLAGAGVFAWRSRPQATALPVSGSSTVALPATTPAGIVVAVAGKVRHPGLVRLPGGSRVADALEAAGGPLPGADLGLLNLARKLTDGEQVLVGVTPAPGPAPGQPAADGLVNLNTAAIADLDGLPGIGPTLAQRIVAYRDAHGGFRSVDELRQVDGIGDAKFAEISARVTV